MDRLHDILCSRPDLRRIVCQHSEPSTELANFVTWLLPPDQRSVEIGLSALSVLLARRASAHLSVLPSRAQADLLLATLADRDIEAGRLEVCAAEGPAGLAAVPAASVDTVVLSCSPAFPAYFAWCHEALRILRVGGRLIVRGTGVWTIEQFKNHLRIDPRFVGWSIIAPDAVLVVKHAETQQVEWAKQPFVLVNSTVHDEATLRRARSEPLNARIEQFSPVAAEAARVKLGRTRKPEVGLIGYYGFGNYGDELFRTAFELGLPDVRLEVFTNLPRRPFVLGSRAARAGEFDALLIGGGDLLSPGYWPDPYFDEAYLAKPIFVHGVGVPRWGGGDPRVIKRLRAFMQHPNVRRISARDVESRSWIQTHLQPTFPVDLVPDIVFGMDLGQVPSTGSRERPVVTVITRKLKASHDAYEGLRSLIRSAKDRGMTVRALIAGAGMIAEDDLADLLDRDLDCDEIVRGTTMEDVTAAIFDSDLVISMKFHGCVVGLMAGKPTFSLIQTDKFMNLYRALAMDSMALSLQHPALPHVLDLPAQPIGVDRLAPLRAGARAAMADLNRAIVDAVG